MPKTKSNAKSEIAAGPKLPKPKTSAKLKRVIRPNTAADSKALIECLRGGNLDQLKALVRDNSDSARSPQTIVEAARLGWTAAVKLLHLNGADLNADWRKYRPLHALIQEKPHAGQQSGVAERVKLLNWMLGHGADPEQFGGWPAARALITAAFVGEVSYVKALEQGGAIVDGFVSAALGDVSRIEKTLKRNAAFTIDRDPSGLTALHCCAGSRLGAKDKRVQDGLRAIAKLLLDRGADIEARVRSWSHDVDAVYFAVASGQREVFGLLLERGADPTQALVPVVWQNDTEMAELALARGGNPDLARDDGKPLLNQMIRWGQFKQALWMLEHGADPNIADSHGWTSMHQAASRGNEKMMKALLMAGGNPALKDRSGNTAIEVAIARQNRKIVELLGG